MSCFMKYVHLHVMCKSKGSIGKNVLRVLHGNNKMMNYDCLTFGKCINAYSLSRLAKYVMYKYYCMIMLYAML